MGKKILLFILAVITSVSFVYSQNIKEKKTLKLDSIKRNEQLLPEKKDS